MCILAIQRHNVSTRLSVIYRCHLLFSTVPKDCLWTFLLVNFSLLLRKRKHCVESQPTPRVRMQRRKKNSKKDIYSSKSVKKSPDSCEAQNAAPSVRWAAPNVLEQGRTLLSEQDWRAPLPVLCPPCVHWPDCRAQLNTGSPMRETEWTLLSREK